MMMCMARYYYCVWMGECVYACVDKCVYVHVPNYFGGA